MSKNEFSFNINNKNLSKIEENFSNLKEEESAPINPLEYKISIQDSRSLIINWISFLCSKLNFSNHTLFRCISIFDQYISKMPLEEAQIIDKNYLSLIAIACLSLSTKLEEINCNYVNFLNEKVLSSPDTKIYTNKDLTKMEFKILKTLKYKTIYSTPLDFVDIYIAIFKNKINSNLIEQIKNFTLNLVINAMTNEIYLTTTASQLAYVCFTQVLNQMNLAGLINEKQMNKRLSCNYQFSNVYNFYF